MFASTSQFVLVNSHGCAAAATTAAALPPSAAGNLTPAQSMTAYKLEVNAPGLIAGNQVAPSTMQPPSAASMTPGAAAENLGNMGTEYGIALPPQTMEASQLEVY